MLLSQRELIMPTMPLGAKMQLHACEPHGDCSTSAAVTSCRYVHGIIMMFILHQTHTITRTLRFKRGHCALNSCSACWCATWKRHSNVPFRLKAVFPNEPTSTAPHPMQATASQQTLGTAAGRMCACKGPAEGAEVSSEAQDSPSCKQQPSQEPVDAARSSALM